jgi:hypothetical protein
MDGGLLALAAVVAGLIVAWFSKPVKTLVGGIFIKDKRGRMTLVLTPAKRKKRKGRK